ncbi:ABC transporter [Streptococcus gallolyticus subsp. gallolyticus]|jgi:putative ABC transport system ATP-binding protein|uniref:ABC transporter ATP-binding protein n=5 Tax=Streptococcus gallolyticus TaxID=315405 RepID=A0A060RFY1_9STRE|nr:ABC transporter ATP-binding protein [Streptococcus gallolyticus]AQP42068.1 ABC transporter ATP-binding protein [Streptococcus gallolyticus subsp. gallolyticus DSM 16831]KJE99733.1 ABC transporter [Streptococcus gallolyticus subsp. gallolyticus]MCO7178723.1 ABC transporter ATP-binding protein [Streptococcus gallolyticus]MCY7152076.1 ABC transporter ATP-binding protein [Streptococcus gallolyticus subsp. gallolyticus]MCY7155350.1 ABC transporter ATP-binding protein [Streptococcus gallolyticus 
MTLRTHNIGYWYTNNPDDYLFKDVNLTFEKGKVYSILGQSGSGKTTFLSLLAGLDSPKAGEIYLEDNDINKSGLTNYRKNSVSTIFQAYNLMTYMTARQNVQTALEISNKPVDNAKIEELFELVGIPKEMIDKPVLQLSGGQQQRVAIVRALATEHDLIIADEPTGNLDEETTQDIVNIFKDIAHKQNKTVIIVTHETAVAQETDVTFELKKKQFTEV